MTALVLLVMAIVSALCFPRAKGNARLLVGFIMLAFLAGFLMNVVHFAHPGL